MERSERENLHASVIAWEPEEASRFFAYLDRLEEPEVDSRHPKQAPAPKVRSRAKSRLSPGRVTRGPRKTLQGAQFAFEAPG